MPGTIVRRDDDQPFVLGSSPRACACRCAARCPMHFRDRLEVVARGRIASDGTGWQLDGERLLSLFADKYDGGPRTLDTRYQ